jgi:hypothetical protein
MLSMRLEPIMRMENVTKWKKLSALWIDFQARWIVLGLASLTSVNQLVERAGATCVKPISKSMSVNGQPLTEAQMNSVQACGEQWVEDYRNLLQANILMQWELNDWSDQLTEAWLDVLKPGEEPAAASYLM